MNYTRSQFPNKECVNDGKLEYILEAIRLEFLSTS